MNSNDLSSSYWQIGGGQGLPTTTQDALSPVGDLTAWTIDDTATGADGQGMDANVSGLTASSTQTYTMSVYAKKGTAAKFDMYCFFKPNIRGTRLSYTWDTNQIFSNGSDNGGAAPVSTGQEHVGNGWYRIWMEVIDSTLGTNTELEFRLYPASRDTGPTGSTLFWNPQVVNGSTPGRYIKTYGSAITAPTTVKNLSSSSNTGTISGTTFNSDGYFEFDGTDGTNMRITLDSPVIPATGSWTAEGWVYLNNTNVTKMFMTQYSNGGDAGRFQMFFANDGTIRMHDGSGIMTGSVSDCPSYSANVWTHVVWQHNDANENMIYVNGVKATSDDQTTTTSLEQVNTLIGSRYNLTTTVNFDGRIGNARVYNTALNATEVLQNFNATRSKYGV